MKTKGGYLQGYNSQAAVNEAHFVIACGVTQEANDLRQYQPMLDATTAALAAVGVSEAIGIVLADAGYWSETNATTASPDRLIATLKDHKQRRAARDLGTTTGPRPDDAGTLDAMEHRLRTPEGATDYAKRSHTVKPVFGDNKHKQAARRPGAVGGFVPVRRPGPDPRRAGSRHRARPRTAATTWALTGEGGCIGRHRQLDRWTAAITPSDHDGVLSLIPKLLYAVEREAEEGR